MKWIPWHEKRELYKTWGADVKVYILAKALTNLFYNLQTALSVIIDSQRKATLISMVPP